MARSSSKKATLSTISPDWPVWGQKLAKALARLEEDQYLIISTKRGQRYVQFAGQGSFGIRMETCSNEFLPKPEKLIPAQRAALIKAGWNKPTHKSTAKFATRDPHGSCNYYFDVSTPVSIKKAAKLSVKTLAEILEVPHPGYLHYEAFESEGGPLEFPELGLKRAQNKQNEKELSKLLLDAVKEFTRLKSLKYDRDGDIGVIVDSILLSVRLVESASHVRIRAHLLRNVKERPELYEALNDLNVHGRIVRYGYVNGVICLTSEFESKPFSKFRVSRYFNLCVELGNALAASMKSKFGGENIFTNPLTASSIH